MSTAELKCPHCGSSEISKPRFSASVFAISILLLGVPLSWMSKTIHCFDCGQDFKKKK
jgi:DNA-directed RNA polymerase subunit RPC12/RpoP